MTVLTLGIVSGAMYGLIAVGIVLIYRGTKVINFAQGEIGTFSLYLAWFLTTEHGLPWWVGAVAAVGGATLIGMAFEFLVVRRMVAASRVSVAVATIGLASVLAAVELKVWGITLRSLRGPVAGDGVKVGVVYVTPTQMISLAVLAGTGVALAWLLRSTDFGLGVLAAADDPTAVRLVGVRLSRVTSFTWGAGAALAAVAALLLEPTIRTFSPDYAGRLFVAGLVAALVGGLSSLPGAFAGGIVVGVIEAYVNQKTLTSTVSGLSTLAMFALILLVLLVRPRGLLGKAPA
ncbi:MAG: branched-chain amino acid transport system permease protein [Frankiaceae bacterium]|jgi:branched-chain amino acid transport system permease protein|nr:branched-chain amino acid transport system permease protein [Frankiaceae bacterium]